MGARQDRSVCLGNVYSFQILLLPAFQGQLPNPKLIAIGKNHLSSYKDLCMFVAKSGIRWSEQTREFATMVMLVSIAFFFGKNMRERVAGFLIAFGVWDIFYYLFLYLWLRWPENLLTWDILFLIPCPWVSPVIVPVCISLVMISGGLYMLNQPKTNIPN